MKPYFLTPEHTAQLKPWADKWIKNGMSTAPMTDEDRRRCVEAVKEMYKLAGKPAPIVTFVRSPFELRFAAGAAAAIWHLRKNSKYAPAFARMDHAATYSALSHASNAVQHAIGETTSKQVSQVIVGSIRKAVIENTVTEATREAVNDATQDSVGEILHDALITPLPNAINKAMKAPNFMVADARIRLRVNQATMQATNLAAQDATYDAAKVGVVQAQAIQATDDATSHMLENTATQDATYKLSDAAGLAARSDVRIATAGVLGGAIGDAMGLAAGDATKQAVEAAHAARLAATDPETESSVYKHTLNSAKRAIESKSDEDTHAAAVLSMREVHLESLRVATDDAVNQATDDAVEAATNELARKLTNDATSGATMVAVNGATSHFANDTVYEGTAASANALTFNMTSPFINDATAQAVESPAHSDPNPALENAVFNAIAAATTDTAAQTIEKATEGHLDDALAESTIMAVNHSVKEASNDQILNAVDASTSQAVNDAATKPEKPPNALSATNNVVRDSIQSATVGETTGHVTHSIKRDTMQMVDTAIRSPLREEIDAMTSDSTRRAVNGANNAVVESTERTVTEATREAVTAAVNAATVPDTQEDTVVATHIEVGKEADERTRSQIFADVSLKTGNMMPPLTEAATSAAMLDNASDAELANWYVTQIPKMTRFQLECAKSIWRCYQGGNFWSGWTAFLSFFRDVAKLDIDFSKFTPWETLTERSSVRIVHEKFCMISDRPCILKEDAENRPHCEDGPFCAWRDGSGLFAVHGVRVPAWVVMRKAEITPTKIMEETNAEVRRVMINFYGIEKYIATMRQVDCDDWGSLYRQDFNDGLTICVLQVVNSTPEPDGTFKNYFLRVNPTLYNGMAGEKARAALASTWRRKDGRLAFENYLQYDPLLET